MKYTKLEIAQNPINAHKLRGTSFYQGVLSDNQARLKASRSRIKIADLFECVLCGGRNGKLVLNCADEYQLFECQVCSAVSANIDLENESGHVASVYQEDDSYYQQVLSNIVKTFDYRKSLFGKQRFDYCLKRVGLEPDSAKVLDVGCGVGYFLSYLKDMGVEARGLEVDPCQVRYCTEIGLSVGSNELSKEPDGKYDLITMFDVLEHLANPVSMIGTAADKLRPGGYLIAYTPSFHSVGFELMGAKQNLLCPFQHVCFYTEKSLGYLSKQVGLNLKSVEYYGLDVIDYLLMKEYEDQFPYTEKLEEFTTMIQGCLDTLKVSNHMRVTFYK